MKNAAAPQADPTVRAPLGNNLPTGRTGGTRQGEPAVKDSRPAPAQGDLLRECSLAVPGAQRGASRPAQPRWMAVVSGAHVSTTLKSVPATPRHAGKKEDGGDKSSGSSRTRRNMHGILCVLYVVVLCVVIVTVTAYLARHGKFLRKRRHPVLLVVSSTRKSTRDQSLSSADGGTASTTTATVRQNDTISEETAVMQDWTYQLTNGGDEATKIGPKNNDEDLHVDFSGTERFVAGDKT